MGQRKDDEPLHHRPAAPARRAPSSSNTARRAVRRPAYSQRRAPGSDIARDDTKRCQTNSTTTAPTTAPIRPAPWSGRYQPIAWPIKVAMKAPAMPSSVVRMKPAGLFDPGRQEARDDAGDKTDDDDPENVA